MLDGLFTWRVRELTCDKCGVAAGGLTKKGQERAQAQKTGWTYSRHGDRCPRCNGRAFGYSDPSSTGSTER